MMRPAALVLLLLTTPLLQAWVAPQLPAIEQQQSVRDALRETQQRQSLADAKKQLNAAVKKASQDDRKLKSLQLQLQENKQVLESRVERLQQERGASRELYTMARQAASDLAGILRSSQVAPPSAAVERELLQIAASQSALNLDSLASLWEAMHATLTYTATHSREQLPVQVAPGQIAPREITRIGTMLALSTESNAVFDRASGVYRLQTTAIQQPKNMTALKKHQTAVVSIPFTPGQVDRAQPDAIQSSIGKSGPIGILIALLGVGGVGILFLRYILITRMLRADRRMRPDSASERLRTQSTRHPNEASESLAGWLNATVRHEARKAQWGHTLLSVIIGAAPLLGLLGTVTGMIVTFDALRLYGSGDPVLMADGIAQALSTTLLGLAVAIPLLIGQRWLLSSANGHVRQLDGLALKIIADAGTGHE